MAHCVGTLVVHRENLSLNLQLPYKKLSTAAHTPAAAALGGPGAGGSLGFTGHEPSSVFSEQSYLKEIK